MVKWKVKTTHFSSFLEMFRQCAILLSAFLLAITDVFCNCILVMSHNYIKETMKIIALTKRYNLRKNRTRDTNMSTIIGYNQFNTFKTTEKNGT